MMYRLIIFALFMLAMAGICNGQGKSNFGATRAQDTSITFGQLKLVAYGGSVDTMLLVVLPNGNVKKVDPAGFQASAGFGLDKIGNVLFVDSTEIATQYDISLKLDIGDTSSMLAPYLRKADSNLYATQTDVNARVKYTDTAAMLAPYLRSADTTDMLAPYARKTYVDSSTATAWKLGGNSVAGVTNFGTTSNFDIPFITNNTEKMRLSTDGKLGIGTNNPLYGIHLVNPLMGGIGWRGIVVERTNDGGSSDVRVQGQNGFGGQLTTYGAGILPQFQDNLALIADKKLWLVAAGATDQMIFSVGGINNEKMRLEPDGDLGIGTINPTFKLDVNGSFRSVPAAGLGTTISGATGLFEHVGSGANPGESAVPIWVVRNNTCGGCGISIIGNPYGNWPTMRFYHSTGAETNLQLSPFGGQVGNIFGIGGAGTTGLGVPTNIHSANTGGASTNYSNFRWGTAQAWTGTSIEPTSGTVNHHEMAYFLYGAGFNPTSGNAQFNVVNIAPTINQTGTANGITRGTNVTYAGGTAAADFRAFEANVGTHWGFYSNSAKHYFGGKLLVGTTTPPAELAHINGTLRVTPTANSSTVWNGSHGAVTIISDPTIFQGERVLNINATGKTSGLAMGIGGGGQVSDNLAFLGYRTTEAGISHGFFFDGAFGITSIRASGMQRFGILRDNNTAANIFGAGGGTFTGPSFTFVTNAINGGSSSTPTAGTWDFFRLQDALGAQDFRPTSGNAQMNTIRILTEINQTGGASGVTRGFFANPNLIAAADYRAFEASVGSHWGFFLTAAKNFTTGTIEAVGFIETIINTSGALAPTPNRHYFFSGAAATWTLPAVAGNTNAKIKVKNVGTGAITVNSNAGGNDIFGGSAVNTFTVNVGDFVEFVNNGTYWGVE